MEELFKHISTCKNIPDARRILKEHFHASENIDKAIDLAILKHSGQFRKSGEPYVVHPILVASIVAHYGGDEPMLIAAILHDVVEDTDCSIEQVEKMFGTEVSKLVEGLTKIVAIREDKLVASGSGEKLVASAMSFRKMLVASINDVRVLVIKLCDRLHNMLTLDILKPDKQKRISEETLYVYVPIAHRLGISTIKNQMEDLCFFYLLPDEYKKIDSYLIKFRQQLQLKLNLFIEKINTLMLQNGFSEGDFTLEKRIKHHYSIYLKMQRKGISIEEVLDLLAIRIIANSILDCYKILGIMHRYFNPIISRFKDYIGIPKENGYQTIHTTVFDDKSIIEAQIRTYDMHQVAEFGIAAHWKYKSSGGINPKLDWLSDINSQNSDNEDVTEFYQLAKENLFSEDIAVFSPKGDIFTLPRGATALDFAYEVHTEVGNHTKEAYVNRQKVPLLTELKNGDIVRIVTSEKEILRCSWIHNIKTGKARNAIMLGCRQKIRELNHRIAIDMLAGIFNVSDRKIIIWLKKDKLYKKVSRIAYDSVYLQDIVNQLRKHSKSDRILLPLLKFTRREIKKQKFENIVVYSNWHVNNVMFDYCCYPKRGDDIVGFIKKTGDVTVHHKMCEKASKIIDSKEQTVVFVKWTRDAPRRYKILINLENKRGSLATFLLFLSKMQVNLQTIDLGKSDEGEADFFRIIIELPEEANADNIRENLKDKYKLIDFVSLNDAYKK